MKIDWKRKLTSRKFWALITGLVIGIVVYTQSPDKSPEKLAGVITAAGSIIAYIFGEGIADSGTHIADVGNMVSEIETEGSE
ncbi:MAG: hypothetical protein IK104_01055 [Clostridia bacterium]|nr:hypothetical protein [Clostridia bacterium]